MSFYCARTLDDLDSSLENENDFLKTLSKAVMKLNVSYEGSLSSNSTRRPTGYCKASAEPRQFLWRHSLVLYKHVGLDSIITAQVVSDMITVKKFQAKNSITETESPIITLLNLSTPFQSHLSSSNSNIRRAFHLSRYGPRNSKRGSFERK
jgi:hypothetical protein